LDLIPDYSRPVQPRTRRRFLRPLLFLGLPAVYFLFFCSGLHFPMLLPFGSLNGHLRNDLGLTLPAGTRVVHAVREASRDPGEYYELQLPTQASVIAFVASLKAPNRRATDRDPNSPWSMGPAPDWWRPSAMPQVESFDLNDSSSRHGFIWFHSPTSTTLYVFWFGT